MENRNFKRITQNEYKLTSFCMLPMELLQDDYFADMKELTKIVYGLLLYRNNASLHNENFVDENGYVYCIFKQEDIAAYLHKSLRTISNTIKELKEYGLIEVERTRNGASRIYINSIANYEYACVSEHDKNGVSENCVSSNAENCTSGYAENCTSGYAENCTSGYAKNCVHKIYTENINNNIYSVCQSNNNTTNPSEPVEEKTDRRTDNNINQKSNYKDLQDGELYPVSLYEDYFPELGEIIGGGYSRSFRSCFTYDHFKEECRVFNLSQYEKKKRSREELEYLYDVKYILLDKTLSDEDVNNALEYLTDVIALGQPVKIGTTTYEVDFIADRFYKLGRSDFEFAISQINKFSQMKEIINVPAYYIKTFINAKNDNNTSTQAKVNYNWYN